MSRAALLLTVFGACLAAWLSWWAWNTFELVEVEYRAGYSPEARRNPLLAAHRFLERMGMETESVVGRDRLNNLPPVSDVLIVSNLGPELNPVRQAKLMAWVERGGHLIFPAHLYLDEVTGTTGHTLLDDLGVALVRVPAGDAEPEEDAATGNKNDSDLRGIEPASAQAGPRNVIVATVSLGTAPIEVGFSSAATLIDIRNRFRTLVRSEAGPHVLRLAHGSGLVTVVSDFGFMSNVPEYERPNFLFNSIKRYDNAWFLWQLVQDASKVWLLYQTHYPPLNELLWKHAPRACIAFAILLAFWLWWLRSDFGPAIPPEERSRRSVLEQLRAIGNFEWAQDRARRRVSANRQQILNTLQRRYPQINRMGVREVGRFLAGHYDLSPADIEFALAGSFHGEREFIHLTNLLRQLREEA